jgi:Terminase large subunit, T4likevirus-type, N-terminal
MSGTTPLRVHEQRMLEELQRKEQHLARIQRERLRSIDVFKTLEYVPTARQQEFHSATEYDVFYGGALGGGKTLALLMEGLRTCVRYPGIRVGAFRRTYPELKESLIKELAERGFANSLGAKWAGSEYELRFPNGSVFMFRYAENMTDASRRLGAEFQLMIFDERTQTPPDVLTFLESRIRSGRAEVPVIGIRSASNPGGPSHSAAKTRYIEPTNYGQKIIEDVRGRSVRFIPSKVSDNPHLNDEYRKDLLGLPEQLRKAYLEGNWDVFEGQMFPELSYDRHVIEPVDLPGTWRRYIGVDWGFSAPWAVLWGAVDPDGRLWIYREIYQKGVGEKDQARRILEAEERDEHISGRFADDQMWAVMGDAKPIAQVYAENGVPLDRAGKGPGSRVNGWQRIHSFLEEDAPCQYHAALGWESCPRIHFFKQCMSVFKELTDLPHARIGNPEDSDPKAPDHACDALRYMAVNLGNDSKFHWPEQQKVEVVLDPKLEGPVQHPYGYNTIGGFPILGPSGNPWEL